MSETITPETDPQSPTDSSTPPADTDPITPPSEKDSVKDWEKEAEKWKSNSRKNEQAAKTNAEKAKAFDEFQESQKTEMQKLTDRADAAEAKASAVEALALRMEVAADKGIPASLLTGSTKDELEAAADALLAFRGDKAKPDFGAGDRGKPITEGAAQWTQSDLDKATREKRWDDITKADDAGLFNKLRGVTKA